MQANLESIHQLSLYYKLLLQFAHKMGISWVMSDCRKGFEDAILWTIDEAWKAK